MKNFSKNLLFFRAIKRYLWDNKQVKIILLPVFSLIVLSTIAELEIRDCGEYIEQCFDGDRNYNMFYSGIRNVMFYSLSHYSLAFIYCFIFKRQLFAIRSVLLQKSVNGYMGLDFESYHTYGTGKISSLIIRQTDSLCKFLSIFVLTFCYEIVFFNVGLFKIARDFGYKIFLIFIVLLTLLFIFVFFCVRVISYLRSRHNDKQNNVYHKMHDILNNYNIIKAFNTEEREINSDFSLSLRSYEREGKHYSGAIVLFSTFYRLIILMSYVMIAILFFNNGFDTAFNRQKMQTLMRYFHDFKDRTTKLKNFGFDFTEHRADVISCESGIIKLSSNDTIDSQDYLEHNDSIVFKDVSLQHGSNALISGFNLEIVKGQKIALTGRNGSGKSSIINALLGFNKYSGSITIDGTQISSINEKALRDLISYVPQEPHILNSTVMANLGYYYKDISQEAIVSKCIQFKTHSVFKNLQNGYHTRTGEGGKYLSGGQCQLINFMRAAIKDAPIFVLDEPTSNLDYQASEELLDMIFEHLSDKTIILSTHNPYHLSRFDKIINIHNGHVNIYNSFEEFKASCGARMFL